MVNYQNGMIYKICCKDPSIEDIYIGSTCNLKKRKEHHKAYSHSENSRKYNYKVYQYIRSIGGWDFWQLIKIEDFPCENKRELESRERYWIELLKPSLNCCIPTKTKTEWDNENRDKIREYQNKYINSEKGKKTQKEHYQQNKENVLKKQKEYYENNKEKIAKREAERYQKNKEKICAKVNEYRIQNEKELKDYIICECGHRVQNVSKSRHKKSKKHMQWLESLI